MAGSRKYNNGGLSLYRLPIDKNGTITLTVLLLSFLLTGFGALAKSLPQQLKGHGGPIKAISLSKDGSYALTASFDYSIIYWDLRGERSRIIHRMIGHDNAVNDVAFVPGEKLAVSVSDDGSLGVWRLSDGKLVKRISSNVVKVLDVAVSADGKLAAASRWDKTVALYDLISLTQIAILKGHRGNVNAATFSGDSKTLYSAAYDGQVISWDVETGQMQRPVYRHGWGINSLEIISGGALLFGAIDGTVGVITLGDKNKTKTLLRRERPIQSVKVSRDGQYFAAGGGDGAIQIFDAKSHALIRNEIVTFGPVWDFDFIAGTTQIFHVGLDDFAMRWQIAPQVSHKIKAEFPRRFQLAKSDDPGELEFQRKCSVCHTLVRDGKNRAGPTLYGLFGREAGTLHGYQYSQALINSTIIWNEVSLARLFDDGPDVVTPGTKMPIQRLKSVKRRDALISFLKKATITNND